MNQPDHDGLPSKRPDNSSIQEINHYLMSCQLGKEDEAFLASLSLDSLISHPWHVQLRVMMRLPSNDTRMTTLLPHLAAKVEKLEQEERDLAVMLHDKANDWRNNVLFQHWITTRHHMIEERRRVQTTKHHMRLFWGIIHGMDEILGEPSIDFHNNTQHPIYEEAARRQADVFERWQEAEQRRISRDLANMLSPTDTPCSSLDVLFAHLGDMDLNGLTEFLDSMCRRVAHEDLETAVSSILSCCCSNNDEVVESLPATTVRKGRAILVALLQLATMVDPSMAPTSYTIIVAKRGDKYESVLGAGLCLLLHVGFHRALMCSTMLQDTWNRLVALARMRKELTRCGISGEEVETIRSMLITQSLEVVKDVSLHTIMKKRVRESADVVIHKLYGDKNVPSISKTALARAEDVALGQNHNDQMMRRKQAWHLDDDTFDDEDYDESDDRILIL